MSRMFWVIFIVVTSFSVSAADMDARLNMAVRLLSEIDSGLSVLQTGDASSYNSLSKKLTKAANMLKSTESKQHPEYIPSTQRWNTLRQSLVDTASQWQSQQQNASRPSQREQATTQTQPAAQARSQPQAASNEDYTLDTNTILAKYHPDNRPQINDQSSIDEVASWAESLAALRGEQLQADIALLDSGAANPDDATRVKRWISGEFQNQISSQIQYQFDRESGLVRDAHILARMILDIPPDDEMRVYNFSHGENGQNNENRLLLGVQASEKLGVLDKWFPGLVDPALISASGDIASASNRFAQMRKEAIKTGEKLATLPKKERPKRPEFLKPIEQEIWLNGRYTGSLSTKGTVYIESKDVGTITSDGRIWVRGNDAGSIETNGEVWFQGSQLGSLEENGEVWRSGSQIGLVEVEDDGAVWIGGSKDGKIEPYASEWKRAAIVFFFRDVFDAAY